MHISSGTLIFLLDYNRNLPKGLDTSWFLGQVENESYQGTKPETLNQQAE